VSERNEMDELLCSIEILKSANSYLAKVQSELGGLREYKSPAFEEVLEQVIIDIQEEFETAP
jgi:hypothetical protein